MNSQTSSAAEGSLVTVHRVPLLKFWTQLSTSHSPLVTAPISSLESALTSHFAPKFDLKSFRMRTYVTPGGEGGGYPKCASTH